MRVPTSSRWLLRHHLRAQDGRAVKNERIHADWRRLRSHESRRGIVLHGEQRIDDCGMLMSVAIILIVVMRDGMILVFMPGGGMQAMTVIHLGQLHLTAAIALAHVATMNADGLCPADRKKCDETDNKADGARWLHERPK